MTTTAWTGLWCDGEPGWRFSPYLHPRPGHTPARNVIDSAHFNFASSVDDRFFKVKVTIEMLKDKRGRYIMRRGGAKP